MGKEKGIIISNIVEMLIDNNISLAKSIITSEYPHKIYEVEKRTYTLTQKMEQFIRGGFIDRYFNVSMDFLINGKEFKQSGIGDTQ